MEEVVGNLSTLLPTMLRRLLCVGTLLEEHKWWHIEQERRNASTRAAGQMPAATGQ